MRVRYVSTETFMNEFVETLRAKDDMGAFERRYRECDLLLIDDVQFMDKKESLQEELFHTFNSLYGSSKQIVLTSDRPPGDRHFGGPPAQQVAVRTDHRYPAPGAGDSYCNPANQGRA